MPSENTSCYERGLESARRYIVARPGFRRDWAIVVGGSVGGLLAARVLADYCKKVIVLECDEFPSVGSQRRGGSLPRTRGGLMKEHAWRDLRAASTAC
jgi:hypothetical protein